MVDGTFRRLLVTGMLGFSSSFLFRDNLSHPGPKIPVSKTTKKRAANNGVLYVLADFTDIDSASSTQQHNAYSLREKTATDSNDKSDTKNTLTFRSSFQRQSNPLAKSFRPEALDEFFLDPDHLLSAGKSVHSEIVPTTHDLFREWEAACDHAGASPPSADHGVVMTVRTAGISIPGLSVEWSAVVGTNLVHRGRREGGQPHQRFPELEFVLIKDENKVSSGAKPIVWIFNKLTRARKTNASRDEGKRGSSGTRNTKLFTRLGVYKNDDDSDSWVIRCAGTMEMKFRIPSLVGNLVFSSDAESQKADVERKISNLITRQIEKDTEQNVMRWEENFRSWTSSAEEHRGEE